MNKIKLVLDKKGIKQKWLAEQLGKSFNMVNSYVEVDELLYSKDDIEQSKNKQ